MSDENENEDLAKLMAIVNQEEEEEDEEQLTEEELQQALNSPSLHRHIIDEESTECDDFEMSSGDVNINTTTAADESDHKFTDELCAQTSVRQKPGEYQFQMLEHHIFKGKHGKKLYKCDVCYAVYRHSFSLKRHFIRSHINYGYLCETDVTNCGINLSASASLQTWKEQLQNSGQTTLSPDMPDLYCCHSCVLFYDKLLQIKGHVDDCHRNNSSGTIEPIRIPCSECNMSFIQRHNLMRHIEVVHNGKRLYACKHCSKKFQTIADRKKHEKSQHSDMSESGDNSSLILKVTATAATNRQKSVSHRCVKCSELFPTYPELRKHVNRKHKEFFNPCGFCNKFCFSKKQLSAHLRQKHEKTAKDNSKSLRQKNKESTNLAEEPFRESSPQRGPVRSQQMSQQNQFQAYFHCSLCYRRFLTYGSLIRHKQIAHRPQSVRNCSRLRVDPQLDNEITEPFTNRNEFEFYRNLAQKMAENLLYFVDGKSVNTSNDFKVIRNPHQKKVESIIPEINLQKYNFPEGFQCRSSPPPSSNQSEKLEFLLDCNLNTVKNPKFKPLIIDTSFEELPNDEQPSKPLFLCNACQQKISAEVLSEHETNNHPNVKCSYIEIKPELRNIPSQLLLWQYHCSEGLLRRCPTVPVLSRVDDDTIQSLNCTKCQKSFSSVSLLHNHILECAHNNNSKKKLLNNSNKSHNNTETQTTSLRSTSTPNAMNTSDTQTEANSSHSSETTEFSSPLSPCKTRSGKRRQISPEEYTKNKRLRNTSKNSSNDSKTSQKSSTHNNDSEISVKNEDIDKTSKISNQKQNKISIESTTHSEISNNLRTDPKNLIPVSEDDNQKSSLECLPKRYSCKKCSKKFVYMDSLSKHKLLCNKRVFTSKINTKRKLRNSTKISQKLTKNIELKALKNIKQTKQNSDKKLGNSSNEISSNLENKREINNSVTNDLIVDSKDDTEEEEETEDETDLEISKTEEIVKNQSESEQNSESLNNSKSLSGSDAKEHRCPDCNRVYAYVGNFRKHIKNVCPTRKQSATDESNQSSDSKSTNVESDELVVIKVEKPEVEENGIDCSAVKEEIKLECDDEVVFDGETRVEVTNNEDNEEGVDCTDIVSPKESKLDLWRVKQENPQFAFKGSPSQHHNCPYCHRGFTYLANYRKHIKGICPIRLQIDEKKKKVTEENGESDSKIKPMIYTPSQLSVRSQIEDTVLSILRDQTKQDQILQSSEALIKANSESKPESTSTGVRDSNNANIEAKPDSSDNSDLKAQESDKSNIQNKKESITTPQKSSTFKFRTFSCNICHKIFLSYVIMLKHRLSHKLSDGHLTSNDNNSKDTNTESQTESTNKEELNKNICELDTNGDKEMANQLLAANILKRSKEMFINKMKSSATNTTGNRDNKTPDSEIKSVINTTELLEKLARGGITTQSIEKTLNTSTKSSTKSPEVITIETNNNNSNILNLQLSASTSTNSNNSNNNNNNNLNNSNNNNNDLEDIIINANDLELNVLRDGVIMSDDLQQLIAVNDGKEESTDDLPVNEVLLNLDDIENGNEVWITITDSNAYVQVPNNNTNNS